MTFRDELVEYLGRCQDMTLSGGISFGHVSPPGTAGYWLVPYPETTGYCIPTLIAHGKADRAQLAGEWLARVQQPDGWIPAYTRGIPAAFDTGMVLRGWLALRKSFGAIHGDDIERACKWLSTDEAFTSFTDYYDPVVPGYFALVARPLHDAGYEEAAERFLALADNHLPENTHFHAYVAEALLDWGDDSKARAMLDLQSEEGAIYGDGTRTWICVPATAQMATVWYRAGLRDEADRALAWLEDLGHPLSASVPFDGPYLPYCYPNWATKYALDAIHEQARHLPDVATPATSGGIRVR